MNRETLLNLLFRMIQLQTTRSMNQHDKAEAKKITAETADENGRDQSTSVDDVTTVDPSAAEYAATKEAEENRRSPDAANDDGIAGKEKYEESNEAPNNAKLKSAMQNKSVRENRSKDAWEEDSKRHLAELYRERERHAISNQQKYGHLVMWIFIFWLIFVGIIISIQLYILYQNGEVFSWWTTSVLIASPSGILVVVFRILFPPKAISRRSRRKRRRK